MVLFTHLRLNMKTSVRLFAAHTMALALAAPAWADVGREQAAAMAQSQTGGRVLAVERSESGRRTVWRVKVITQNGEVRVVLIDADRVNRP